MEVESPEVGHVGSQHGLLSKTRRKRWRNALTGLAVVGVIVIVSIVLIATYAGNEDKPEVLKSTEQLRTITLEEFVEYKLVPSKFNGTWISGSEVMYKSKKNSPVVFDFKTNIERPLTRFSNEVLKDSFQHDISPDKKYLLVASQMQKVYRHTFLATYNVIDLETGVTTPVWIPNVDLQLCAWSTVGNALVFVFANNIYYKPNATDKKVLQITTDGVNETLYHGIPDWVYEEEVLSSNSAMWFSPSGENLAFASFNDSETQIMTIPYYGPPGNLQFQYPRELHIRYPKPGTPNPQVSLRVINLTSAGDAKTINEGLISIPAPVNTVTNDHILAAVTWASDTELVAVWMNRVQNVAVITTCDISSGKAGACSKLLQISEPSGWVDIFSPPHFPKTNPSSSSMVLILPQDVGTGESADSYRHVTRVDQKAGENPVITSLSLGKMSVTEIIEWDDKNGIIYFMGTAEGDSAQRHLYRVADKIPPEPVECMTCGVKNAVTSSSFKSWGNNPNCSYNSVSFSKDYSLYSLYCGGPQIPEVSIWTKNGERLLTWEKNMGLHSLLENREVPQTMRMQVPLPGGLEAEVLLRLPSKVDKSGTTKYPMIVYVYGGPDTNQVNERFTADWGTYLATNRSIIYASIDARGSGLRGHKLLYSVYRRLGSIEVEDQINVTRYLQKTFPFIDSKRTAIWGWSYGGYATGMALAKDKDNVFRCGISVAPVTDWAYYDTIYTERYMGLPTLEDNIQGYAKSNLNHLATKIRGKEYLLVHGTLDDNVHFQQSMMLSRVLETRDILFQQLTYPDEEHGLTGVHLHLYHSIEHFLNQCLMLPTNSTA
ncbi:venom dipeptidyl peptidase 4-like [Hetaerina americana]|uniref:venom dipeptidyl peptidase 4-like n=1 Tax=Hetaerina americana TaxID=62018 RepID=UPI003A7F1F9B